MVLAYVIPRSPWQSNKEIELPKEKQKHELANFQETYVEEAKLS